MKYKWDNKNVLDYAVQEAKQEGRVEVVRVMKNEGTPTTQIAKFTGLSAEEIERL